MGLLPGSIPTSLDQLNPFSNGVAGEENAPPLLIQELTGEKRALEIKGRALPYRPTSFGRGGMHSKKTTYPGNPQSTQQVLGPEEGDCTLEGMWKTRFMGGTVTQIGFPRSVTTAADMVEFVDSMRRAGQTVKVQWGPIVRVGLIVGFEPTWDRVFDVRWTLEFEWQSQGEVTTRAKLPALNKPSLLDKLNKLSDLIALGPDFLLPDINAIVVSAIADTRQKIGTIFDAVRQIAKLGRLPADTAGAIAAASMSLRLQVLETINAIAEVPVSNVSASQNAADQLDMERWRREVSEAWLDLLADVGLVEQQTAQRASPPPTKVVTVRQNTTLYQLSLDNYGTADLATFLGDVNFLVDAVVPAGTVVVIPPKPRTVEE